MKGKYFIKAYGCQMNQYETGIISAIMNQAGFCQVDKETEADVIYLLTCSVRNHAEQRALGRFNYLKGLKRTNPDLIIGMLGCMAQSYKQELVEQFGVDLVAGPDQYRRLPELISDYQNKKISQTAVEFSNENYEGIIPKHNHKVTGFISIMRGCNNFCSYCIVPYVRGRERSKSLAQIMQEANHLVSYGVQDITLVGQNVLAWQEKESNFLDLIKAIDNLPGYSRLRFITSHPKNLSRQHLETFTTLTKFCPHIHLPLQSGSDRILQLMNRGYTKQEYLEKIETARKLIPAISFTTDIMVGFPTETEKDYQETLMMVKQIQFDFAYMFKYSERPYAKSKEISPKVDDATSRQRLTELIEIQNQITAQKSKQLLHEQLEVLVESKNGTQAYARTKSNKVIVIKQPVQTGKTYLCKIEQIVGWTPIGKIIEQAQESKEDL